MGEIRINTTYCGDALEILKTFPDNFIDCVVTSPPYYGLRDYGVTGQIGLEKTPDEFVSKLTEVFMEVRRVLKPTGTLWLNLGDSYASDSKGTGGKNSFQPANEGSFYAPKKFNHGMKEKDLMGIPWAVAFALRSSGWWLRQDIIWHKPNPMPESVTDRCTKAHEYIFLLSKSARYYYDAEAVKTPMECEEHDKRARVGRKRFPSKMVNGIRGATPDKVYEMANKRSVWTVNTHCFPEAHFATFPPELIIDCIKAGASEKGCCSECGNPYERIIEISDPNGRLGKGYHDHKDDLMVGQRGVFPASGRPIKTTTGWKPTCECGASVIPALVLDPFNGSGTTRIVAEKLGRNSIGIELNPKYIQIENRRRKKELGMFEKIAS